MAPEEARRQFGESMGGRGPGDAMVAQLTDADSWAASCTSKGGVCVVAALAPDAGADAGAHAAQLAVLRAAAEGRGDQPLHFCWFEAGVGAPPHTAAFAAALGLDGGATPPQLVAVAPKKERAAVMTGRFEKARSRVGWVGCAALVCA